ncbi:phosphoenolpyruvate-protein phosphotransferase [Methylophilales bacterium MBRSG12]|uniref:Phosphoenolpyruvate-protein phosphotransferase n=1 Tax=Methylophilales bacterium MBRS-H7 TaxID=1623450 RepID=A0A0H4J0T9_9PROT|nr:phosphoenolpyruvate-protein phosphotransferase [Methylophilales bacterium MBRSF5]AKO65690.1 phosphoenolpyruvate-protein phosphotransferase [Methylophilales bacterium MBRS-H7]AKO67011.1 phosphoenolpyruvate-protein phosphotransferase [Methylophilales bacterium MBRSG12]
MLIVSGIPVSSGVAIGKAYILAHALNEVEPYTITQKNITNEIKRFNQAIKQLKSELLSLKKELKKNKMGEYGSFIDVQLAIINDPKISKNPLELIKKSKQNAEWSLKVQMEEIINKFNSIENSYIRERKNDIYQVCETLIKYLIGHESKQLSSDKNRIIVAHDISPADALKFKNSNNIAFVTDIGGTTSHTAILAKSINIPSVVGTQNAKNLISNGDNLIVDGDHGCVIINPTDEVINEYKLKQNLYELESKKLLSLQKLTSKTIDKVSVNLYVNIEDTNNTEPVMENNTKGVGLFRTEFIFMDKHRMLDENEQFTIYRNLTKALPNKIITIRTLDSGGDKVIEHMPNTNQNPALGLRAIRFCLAEPDVFITQMKALLRASHYGNIRILIPMLSSNNELRQVKLLIERAKDILTSERKKFNSKTLIGGMIEVPAAAIDAESFASQLDFLSIGTNDLIQYTLAVDRTDDAVSHLYDSSHPALLKLIKGVIDAGTKAGIEVSLCGEMAGDPKLTKLLIGIGLTNFSMHPSSLLKVKKVILESEFSKLKSKAKKILNTHDKIEIENLINNLNN